MRALSIQDLPDRRRQKVLVRDWPEPEGHTGNNAPKDEELPTSGFGYQNVGRVIEVGPDVCELRCGYVLYLSTCHEEYVVMPEDGRTRVDCGFWYNRPGRRANRNRR